MKHQAGGFTIQNEVLESKKNTKATHENNVRGRIEENRHREAV